VLYVLLAVLAGSLLAFTFLLRNWPLINVVETGATPEYPEILPRVYVAKPERVFDASMHAVNGLPRWSLRAYRPETGELHAEARTRIFRFVDDLTIRIEPRQEGSWVHVRSASRIGKGDFGQNARNIRAFFDELDRQMAIGR
jgi:uncharacterized protein (DUF1499 family)